jgi:glycerophosphoryl diester phosphodiesterase
MVRPEGLKAIAAYAQGLGAEWSMILPTAPDGGLAPATSVVADAHAAGLAVHPWTVRAENAFLPPKLRKGANPADWGDVDQVYKGLFAAGVDGLFSDFPALAVKARG